MNSITIHQIGCLVIRAVSILMIVRVLPSIFMAGSLLGSGDKHVIFLMSSSIAILVLGVALWVVSPWLSRKMVAEKSSIESPITADGIQAALLICAGFLVLSESINSFIVTGHHVVRALKEQSEFPLTSVLTSGLRMALCLSLIFTPQGIVRIIKCARTTGGEK